MLENAGFGGGCHWCTEAVFQSLRGVTEVAQGFIAADPPHQAYSEAVSVTWDPDLIGFDDLIAVHLATHASMSQHKMRGKYRSAVYVKSDARADHARRIIAELAEQTGSAFVTAVLPFAPSRPLINGIRIIMTAIGKARSAPPISNRSWLCCGNALQGCAGR